jgi:hypothetical protein
VVPFQRRHSKPFVDRTTTFLWDGGAIITQHSTNIDIKINSIQATYLDISAYIQISDLYR